MTCHRKVAQLNRGRVSDPAQAASSGSHKKAPGSAGGYLLWYAQHGHILTGESPLHKRVTASEEKRNCMRATECGKEAWIEAAGR